MNSYPSMLPSSNNDVVRTHIVDQDDELAMLSVAPPAAQYSTISTPGTASMDMNRMTMAGIGSIAEAIAATAITDDNNAIMTNNYDTRSLRHMIIPLNIELDSAVETATSRNVVATGLVADSFEGQNYQFHTGANHSDWDYENLELNFDDLYSESIAEEEYFVQQPSPLIAQYASSSANTATTESMSSQQNKHTANSTPPIVSAASSYCAASSSTNYDGDFADRNENFEVETNDYYHLAPSLSFASLSSTEIAGIDDNSPDYDKKIAPRNEKEIMTEKFAAKHQYSNPRGSTQYPEDTYILGTLIVRVVAARGLVSVNDFYSKKDGSRNGHQNKSNLNRNKKRRGGGGLFRGNQPEYLGDDTDDTNPYASVRFTILAENLDDIDMDDYKQIRNRFHQKIKRCVLNQQQVQRTSTIHNSCQPVWPRGENMYMDVSHPMPLLPQGSSDKRVKNFLAPRTKLLSDDEVDMASSFCNESSHPSSSNTNVDKIGMLPSSTALKSDHYPVDSTKISIKKLKGSLATKESYMGSERKDSSVNTFAQDETGFGRAVERRRMVLSPIVSCALFHAPFQKANVFDDEFSKQKVKGKKNDSGDSDDLFLGMASLDITSLLTGKVSMIDEWLTLSGGLAESDGYRNRSGNNNRQQVLSTVRLICEYEPTDAMPQTGDYVQFTKFCNPSDLYPLIATSDTMYKVDEVYEGNLANSDDDLVLISTLPSAIPYECWKSSFLVHRYMLILCKEREPSVLETCRDEIYSVAERIAVSPLVSIVNEAVHVRVPEDGLVNVGKNAVAQAVSTIFTRWLTMDNGIQTFLKDITYVTNWDGQHSTATLSGQRGLSASIQEVVASLEPQNLYDPVAGPALTTGSSCDFVKTTIHDNWQTQTSITEERNRVVPLPNMPSCPITGVPMHDPVVAADGHTYERQAIARWIETNDRSPLTGAILSHKNLVPNYMLLSSLQEMASTTTTSVNADTSFDQIETISTTNSLHESTMGACSYQSNQVNSDIRHNNAGFYDASEIDDCDKVIAEIDINEN